MLFSFRSKPQYSSIEDGEYDEELKAGGHPQPHPMRTTIQARLGWILGLLLLSCLSLFSIITFFPKHVDNSNCPISATFSCIHPTIRREWRTLDRADRDDYIAAVQCLGAKPSKLRDNGTLYDDFPWVHKLTAPKGISIET